MCVERGCLRLSCQREEGSSRFLKSCCCGGPTSGRKRTWKGACFLRGEFARLALPGRELQGKGTQGKNRTGPGTLELFAFFDATHHGRLAHAASLILAFIGSAGFKRQMGYFSGL